MLEQERLIARVREIAEADERLLAVLQYGSFSQRQGDRHSDVEFYLYSREEPLATPDRREWLSRVAPLLLLYENEYGVDTAVFASLVRGEFHFEAAGAIGHVADWRTTWAASVSDAVLLDRSGELTAAVRRLCRRGARLDERETARFLAASLLNWTLMGANLLARGDDARAHAFLGFIQTYVLQCERLLAGETTSWEEPRRRLADELPDAYARLRGCTARLRPDELCSAYARTWGWASELLDALQAEHGAAVPGELVEHLDRLLERR